MPKLAPRRAAPAIKSSKDWVGDLKGPVFPAQRENGEADAARTDTAANRIAALEAQLAELKGVASATQRQMQRPRPGQKASAPPPVEIRPFQFQQPDFSKIPDPIKDPKGYADGLAKHFQTQLEAKSATDAALAQQRDGVVQRSQVLANKVDRTWEKFSKAHPEFDGLDDIIEAKAREIIGEQQEAGVALEDLLNEPDWFMSEVASRVNDRAAALGLKLGVDGDELDDPSMGNPAHGRGLQDGPAFQDGDSPLGDDADGLPQDTARTRTIAGGDRGISAPRARKPQAESASGLLDDLKAVQTSLRII